MLNRDELNALFQYAHALCKNKDDAYDLLHTAIEKFLPRQSQVSAHLPYLRKSIKNLWLDNTKKRLPHETIETYNNTLDIDDHSLDATIVNENLLQSVWGKLHADEREILYYWAVLEYSMSEIAEHLSIPRGTLLSKIHRMRKRIEGMQYQTSGGNP